MSRAGASPPPLGGPRNCRRPPFGPLNLPVLTLAANFIFGVALWVALANTQNVLHPDLPIFSSGSLRIEFFFTGLLLLCLFCMLQIAFWFHSPVAEGG